MLVDRPLCWLGSSLEDVRGFPADARREAGYQLARVQRDLMPSDWKPMTSVGVGVQEIRIHTGTEHRVFYVAKFRDAVYVLHAFEKRTRRTPSAAIELARRRLADLRRYRSRQGD
jgi:phage-related protein